MPITINIKSNIKEFTKGLNFIHKDQIPYATSRTINDITYKAQVEVKRQIPNIFDNKKVWWKNRDTGIQRTKSTKYKLEAKVYTGSKNYFAYLQNEGGIKKPAKNKKLTIPFKQNVPRSRLKSGSARKYLNQKNVFISNDIILQKKYKNQKAVALYRLVKKAKIKPRFNFYKICTGVLNSNLEKCFYLNLHKAINSAKRKK